MAVARVPVNPKALNWAMKRAGINRKDLAKAAAVRPENVSAWLQGDERPTYRQARQLANRLRVSFSQLLLPPPERVWLPIQDLRRGRSRGEEPSPELLDAVYDAFRKRDWYREYRGGESLRLQAGSSWRRDSPEDVAEAIKQAIPVHELQAQTTTWAEFLKRVVENVEDRGILVLRQGYVGSNSRRTYDPEEFSGFAIADSVAPVIFLNARDFIARQIFTLAHELAHIWLRQSVLDAGLEGPEAPLPEAPLEEMERFCDRVAATVLMPGETFVETWAGRPYEAAYEAAQAVAKRFKVSAWAALRRALELQLIGSDEYRRALKLVQEAIREREERGQGRNFWVLLRVRNSRAFTQAVLEAASSGNLGVKEVASLLNIRLSTALDFLERAAAAREAS
ncbi:MAG: XRE family transcriptional regulator [Armatimonadota bacterium]|nr:XRE family transcriptional regulator [Armatimonadota bacterium]